jgi:uncharacterized membrane protein
MPAQVPTHWNFTGQPDDWSSREFGAFFFPILLIGMYLLFIILPYLDPKKERYQQFTKVYWAFRLIFILFMTVIYFAAALAGVGYKVPIGPIVSAGIGILFIILGNYMGKIKPNWFVGIKTPWTLSNEEVWNKTHRLGGKLFILLGLFFIISTLFPVSWIFPLIIILVLGFTGLMVLYSYLLYHRLEKNSQNNNTELKP